MKREGNTAALILDTHPYRDADLMVNLFTPAAGKVSAIAYRARSSRKRFPGGLDRLTLVEATISRRGQGAFILESAEAQELFWGVKSDLDKSAAASLWSELLIRAHMERPDAAVLFEATLEFLATLAACPPAQAGAGAFYAGVAVPGLLGFLPATLTCPSCDEPVAMEECHFHCDSGEVTCREHSRRQGGTLLLGPEQVELLALAMGAGSLAGFLDRPGDVQPAAMLLMFAPFLTGLFGRLKSLEFIRSLAGR